MLEAKHRRWKLEIENSACTLLAQFSSSNSEATRMRALSSVIRKSLAVLSFKEFCGFTRPRIDRLNRWPDKLKNVPHEFNKVLERIQISSTVKTRELRHNRNCKIKNRQIYNRHSKHVSAIIVRVRNFFFCLLCTTQSVFYVFSLSFLAFFGLFFHSLPSSDIKINLINKKNDIEIILTLKVITDTSITMTVIILKVLSITIITVTRNNLNA